MSSFNGPNTSTSGIILALDGANERSFKGEAVTNLLGSWSSGNATANTYPSSNNNWGTYHVELYNGNSYFSIGTIASVSNNIVTTATAHPFRTYSVIIPQTTGGGVTAGTNYFVKYISSTSFSLHAYNNTESIGFSAHSSVISDTRVSINSTSFPTMWWGPPHSPNSTHVKEIIPNGYLGIHDCMRVHFFRNNALSSDNGGSWGMAYGVTPTLTSGVTYTLSFKHRAATRSAIGKTVGVQRWTNGNADSNVMTLGENWSTHTFSFTPNNTNTTYFYWLISDTATNWAYDIAEIQLTASSSALPFTTNTRGTTVATGGGWADLSGNSNNGELVNGASSTTEYGGGVVFDGDNDRVTTSSFTYTPYCIDFWLYNNSTVPGNDSSIGGPSQYQSLISFGGGTAGVNLGGWTGAASNEALHIWSVDGSGRLTYTNQAITPGIYNWVFNWNGSYYDIWINGVKQTVYAGSSGHALLKTYTSVPLYLGSDNVTYEFYGKIFAFKMYNSQLSDSQVVQNFNAVRKRFGI